MTKKMRGDDGWPEALAGLPRFGLTSKKSSSRAQNERADIAFGVGSLDELADKLARGFGNPERPTAPVTRGPSKKRS